MPQPDSRLTAVSTSVLRPRSKDSRTVENAPGPAEDRRFGRRLGAVLATLLLLVVGGVVGEHVLGHRNAVRVAGSWVLHEIEHDGRLTVTPHDLLEYRYGVAAQFNGDGTFVIAGRCNATTGDYDVSWDELTLNNQASTDVACGSTDANAERRAMLVSDGVGAILDADTVVASTPSADRLELAVADGQDVLRYDRAPG